MNAYSMFASLKQFLINSGKGYDIDLITRAFECAEKLHDGQYRKSGEDYISHPLSVAQICANMGYDTDCICAALLHDVVEDCPDKTDLNEIKNMFGDSIASLVDGLTKLKGMRFDTKEEESVQNLRKMFFAMAKDPRVMFVKLCDRLHNMRTISSMPDNKQKTIALETMHVFAPVAHRLGIQKIKAELEDLSLRCLDPIGYNQIKDEIDRRFGESRDIIEKSQEKIKAQLSMNNIKFTEEGRVKSINSLYRKIFMSGKPFDDIYDFYAIRYIVNTVADVYHVLGIVHDLFTYIPERFKDYVSMPKENNYQSVHTTVINEQGIPIEVQIRTKEMHEVAEYGIAAHWKYKSGEEAPEELTKKLKWLKSLVDAEKEDISDSEEFLMTIRAGLYADEIFVYTPKGDVKALPKGATIIDFAYAIHSAIGNKTVGAKINGVITPIDAELRNGQMVEILTSNSSKGPNRNWLDFVKTGEARNKIRQWFKKEKRTENILIGREQIERIFKRFNKPLTEMQRDDILNNISKREGFTLVDDFYNAIGYGGLSFSKLEIKMREEFDKIAKEQNDELIFDITQVELTPEKSYSDNTVVIVDGMDNCQIKLSKCCNPLPGDKIFGFVTKGHGLSIHKADCENFINLKNEPENKDRIFSAFWNSGKINDDENKNKKNFKALLKISAVNDPELIRRIVEILTDMKIPIHSINEVKTKSDGIIIINLLISARDVEHLDFIINKLRTVKNIKEAGRNISYY
ncbi:MAG: bifunctional (p)ppGpp synthetase/guanosine-3',5'-bis(diphosphate) 3'-pyrophosphohydrolase [Oscillospiraceae bacterium]|nr:bifunctional (p)ppGpp synthetase/guanosine-3',5'-bis(diphosphate) 3'-pyrophosphohydrolase [Oscillospiraceae bacterium]